MQKELNRTMHEMKASLFKHWFSLCLLANLFGIIAVYYFSGDSWVTKLCITCGGIMIGCYIYAQNTWRYDLASIFLLIPIIWVEFPALYVQFGEITIAYFLLGLFAAGIILPFKITLPINIVSLIIDMVIVWLFSSVENLDKVIYNELTLLISGIGVIVVTTSLIRYNEKARYSLEEANENLEYTANHDALTKLCNRGYLMTLIRRGFDERKSGTMVLIDIDDFKNINDTYGHMVGDEVLVYLSSEILKTVEGIGIGARYGGEELVLLLDEKNMNEALEIVENLARTVEDHFYEQYGFKLTFSGGIVDAKNYSSVDKMISHVDAKLYRAKRNGKNQVII